MYKKWHEMNWKFVNFEPHDMVVYEIGAIDSVLQNINSAETLKQSRNKLLKIQIVISYISYAYIWRASGRTVNIILF